jgi:hypothetical protein
MAVPWLRLIDAALGVASMARGRKAAAMPEAAGDSRLEVGTRALGGLETRLAGVVVAALKEAFDRDSRRLEMERQQLEAERQRAERALKLELLRQSADREIARLRLLAGVAVATFLGTLFLAARVLAGGTAGRVLLGIGWALLLAALAAAFSAQSQAAEAAAQERPASTTAGQLAPWAIVAALATIAISLLIA